MMVITGLTSRKIMMALPQSRGAIVAMLAVMLLLSSAVFAGDFNNGSTVSIVPYLPAVPVGYANSSFFTISVQGNGASGGNVTLTGTNISPTSVNISTNGGQATAGITAPNTPSSSTGLAYTATITTQNNSQSSGSCNVVNWTNGIENGSQDITGGSTNTIVGQGFTLSETINPNLGLPTPLHDWNLGIPPPIVGGFNPDASASNDTMPDFSADSIHFYWVGAGSSRAVTDTSTIYGLSHTATSTFNVQLPSASITEITGTIEADNQYGDYTVPYLHFGNDTIGPPGIQFELNPVNDPNNPPKVNDPPGYGKGSTEWIQIGHVYTSRKNTLDGTWSHCTGTGLDHLYPMTIIPSSPEADDSPACELLPGYSTYTENDIFITYFMYKPDVSDAIWAPLLAMDWQWSASATYDLLNGWSLSGTQDFTQYPSPGIVITNITVPPTSFNCSEIPHWVANIKDADQAGPVDNPNWQPGQ